MTETANQAAETSAQESEQAQVQTQGFTQDDVNKLTGTARKEARQAAINDLLKKAQAESIDEVIEGYQGFKTVEEATQTEADKLKAQLEKVQPRAERATKLEEALTGYLEREREGVPEYVTDLLNKMDVVDQLAWLSQHKSEVVDSSASQATRTFRAADTTQVPANTGDPQQQHGKFLASLLNGP